MALSLFLFELLANTYRKVALNVIYQCDVAQVVPFSAVLALGDSDVNETVHRFGPDLTVLTIT